MFDPLRGSRDRTAFGLIDLTDVREHPGRFIALGIVFVILGVLAIFVPFFAGVTVTILLGWLLVVGGVAEVVHAVMDRRWGGTAWTIFSALISVVAGVLLVSTPVRSKLFLTLVLAGFLVAEGVLKLGRALSHRGLPVWGWLLLDGILSLILGVLLWFHWPSTAAWAIGLLVGIQLLLSGTSMLALGLGAGRLTAA
jgi:uncharacterized membrane protein HdeD (DUF308 family)